MVLYLLVIIGILLTLMVTPTQAEYYKGLWRAVKQGRPRLSFWDDLSPNRLFLVVVCAIVLVTATIAWRRLGGPAGGSSGPMREAFPLAIANGVLVVAYFGLAHQFFQLRFGRRGSNFLALFLFLIWGVPLVVGTITLFANFMNSGPSQVIYALSPVAGLGLATGGGESAGTSLMAVEAAAITPSLLYTFVFNNLVTAARRRVQRAVLIGIEKTKQAAVEAEKLKLSSGRSPPSGLIELCSRHPLKAPRPSQNWPRPRPETGRRRQSPPACRSGPWGGRPEAF